MGEHTIREVLKRRSDDTQRVIRRRRDRATRTTKKKPIGTWTVLLVIVLAIVAAIGYSMWLASTISERFTADKSARAAGRNGATLSLQSTTELLPNTLLAVIDPNFYNNSNLTISPLTSRLVNIYFPDATTLANNMMVVSLQLNNTRTDILEAYINDVYLGQNDAHPITGFAAASQVYFKKPFSQLQPQDIALLVGLIASPDAFDPRHFPDKTLAQRNAVLQLDAQQGVLSQAQVDGMIKAPLDLVP